MQDGSKILLFDADYRRDFPLHAAAYDGDQRETILLIKNSAHVDAPDHLGRTPLHLAALRGHSSVITALLGYGALLDLNADDGKRPLDYAAESGHDEAMRLLQIGHYQNRNKRPL
jgi:uncharacterized protein